jgi:NADH:ubiquinone reductase (H+-translocating)
MKKIEIVGGGADSLELATKLGNKLGKRKTVHIALSGRNTTHLWNSLNSKRESVE